MRSAPAAPPDQRFRDRIRDDLDTNLLVEAGAGSGKTHSLAERMASGIARGQYDVAHMAAVTFTRKAAAELRGRFQFALERRLGGNPPADQAERLRHALAHLERFFAGTIHAFCARLLRERPVEARMAPGFVELDEVEDAIRRERAWRDFIVRESARGSTLLRELRAAGIRPPDLDAAFTRMCDHEDVVFATAHAVEPDPRPAWDALDRFRADLLALLPEPIPAGTTCEVQGLARTFAGRLAVCRRDRPADLAQLLQEWVKPKVVNKWWGRGASRGNPVAERVKALLEAWQQGTIAPFLQAWRAWAYDRAITILTEARSFYADERRRDNVVNYVDLLMVTARVLREDAAVRRALQDKYRWLFIDEFQDTDPIQAEVFLLLASDAGQMPDAGAPLDWARVPLRPGALFVVGDPKQSIYRFRRADIDIYNTVRNRITACGGAVLPLTANFRSVPRLCALANSVFPTRFPAAPLPEAPAFERLEPVRLEPGAASAAIARLTLPQGTDAKDSPAVEAARIAAWIRTEVDEGRRQYGDILVLTRNRPRLDQYARAFERAEIPVEVSGAGMFGGSEEVAWLHGLIEALADPLDGVALVGVLRGPLFGVSDPELFQFRTAGGRFDLTTPLPNADSPGVRADLDARFGPALAAMRQLQQLHRRARRLPLGAALELLLEETGLLAVSAATPGGAEAGDLLQAVDRVRQVAESGGGLADAAAALAGDAREATDVEALPLEPGRRDVVRLMNLHKAKGLEADVVFLADPCHGRRFAPEIRIVREGTRATGWLQIVSKPEGSRKERVLAEPADWSHHVAHEQVYLSAEENRLLYVAATRARELLVVGRSSNPKQNEAWGVLDPFLGAMPELPIPELPPARPEPAVNVSAPAIDAAAAQRRARSAQATTESWRVESVTEEAHQVARAARIRRTAASDLAGPEADPTASLLPETPSHRADAGAAWGTLIHGLLEHAARKPGASRQDLERLARWLLIEDPDLRPFVGEAIDCVEAVMRAPFWQDARRGAYYVEVPFAIRLDPAPPGRTDPATNPPAHGRSRASAPGRGVPVQASLFDLPEDAASGSPPGGRPGAPAVPAPTMPTVLRGVIDLVYRSDEGWRIIDYKTDQVVADVQELVARYGPQVARYRDAWTRVTSEPVAGAGLFSVRRLEVAWEAPTP